jgi:hypothetical protein
VNVLCIKCGGLLWQPTIEDAYGLEPPPGDQFEWLVVVTGDPYIARSEGSPTRRNIFSGQGPTDPERIPVYSEHDGQIKLRWNCRECPSMPERRLDSLMSEIEAALKPDPAGRSVTISI